MVKKIINKIILFLIIVGNYSFGDTFGFDQVSGAYNTTVSEGTDGTFSISVVDDGSDRTFLNFTLSIKSTSTANYRTGTSYGDGYFYDWIPGNLS